MSDRPAISDPAVAMALDDIRRTLSDMDARLAMLERRHSTSSEPWANAERYGQVQRPVAPGMAGSRQVAGHDGDYWPSDTEGET